MDNELAENALDILRDTENEWSEAARQAALEARRRTMEAHGKTREAAKTQGTQASQASADASIQATARAVKGATQAEPQACPGCYDTDAVREHRTAAEAHKEAMDKHAREGNLEAAKAHRAAYKAHDAARREAMKDAKAKHDKLYAPRTANRAVDDYGLALSAVNLANNALRILNAHPHQGRHLESGEYLPKGGNVGRKQVEKAARLGYEDYDSPFEEEDEPDTEADLTEEPEGDDGRETAELERDRGPTGNEASPGEFVATLLRAAPVAHRLHLQTRSFAAHSALDGLYKGLPGLVDDVVEAYQGNHGVITTYGEGESISANDPASFVRSLVRYVKDNRSSLGTDTEIQNAVDEIASLLDSTLYKLSTLNAKNCGEGMKPTLNATCPECGGEMFDGECEDCGYTLNEDCGGMPSGEGEQTRPRRKHGFMGDTKNDEPIAGGSGSPSGAFYKGEGETPSEYKGEGHAPHGVETPIYEGGGVKGAENEANFVSEKQRRYMWSQEPDIAESWAHGEHTSEGPHRMPTETGKDVKGPQAKASRKAMREKMKAKVSNALPETSAQDPHQASKIAAAASLHTEHSGAFGHAQEAMRRSGDEDCKGAARKHLKAAEQHESEATKERSAKNFSEADQHDHAAGLHRKAASMHLAHNAFYSSKMKAPVAPTPEPEEPPPSLDATIPPVGGARAAGDASPAGLGGTQITSGPTQPGPAPEMPPSIDSSTNKKKSTRNQQRGTETMTAKEFRNLMIANCQCEADRTAVADLTEHGLGVLYNAAKAKVKKETGKQFKKRMEKEESRETGAGGDFDETEGKRFGGAMAAGYSPDQAAAIAYGPSRNSLTGNAKAEGSNADVTGKGGKGIQAGGEEDEEELGQYQLKKNRGNPFDDEDEDEEDDDDMSHNQQRTPITQRLTAEELSVWNVAKEIEHNERIRLVRALTANLEGPDRKEARNEYMRYPIPKLRQLLRWHGTTRNAYVPPSQGGPSYLGAGAPALNVYGGGGNAAPSDTEGLDLPTMNYGDDRQQEVG